VFLCAFVVGVGVGWLQRGFLENSPVTCFHIRCCIKQFSRAPIRHGGVSGMDGEKLSSGTNPSQRTAHRKQQN